MILTASPSSIYAGDTVTFTAQIAGGTTVAQSSYTVTSRRTASVAVRLQSVAPGPCPVRERASD